MAKQWIRIRVRKSVVNPEDPLRTILHEHLRYAGVIEIEDITGIGKPDKDDEYIEVRIPLSPRHIKVSHAEKICERIRSFGDSAEVC